ncbi:Crp/Fnr family transcriptional regulator [Flavobacterium sp.]|uniref:Crp/Fnr family transcriptional regulator n=1 Tax=Flavobacterium sp. TaxID=239 RepID=UPI003D0EBF2F
MIPENLFIKYNAQLVHFPKGETIVKEDTVPRFFFQIHKGEVKMMNLNEDGKEFVQGIFGASQTFGEPPLFVGRNYPADAVALTDVAIYCLPKEQLMILLNEHPEVAINLIENLSKRLHYKSVMAVEIAFENPEHRILKLINYYVTYLNAPKEIQGYKIDLTRQQIADLTGLRVETVIKSVKKLEKEGEIKIIDRKIFFQI